MHKFPRKIVNSIKKEKEHCSNCGKEINKRGVIIFNAKTGKIICGGCE